MITTPVNGDERRYFIECCRTKLSKEYFPKISSCLNILSEEDIWWRAHETNNSVGNLILHLSGNIRQWIHHHLGKKPFQREREKEFSERTHISREELSAHLASALTDVDAVLAEFPVDQLMQMHRIQSYEVTALEAILHVTEHFSYHVGQIVYITKLRTGVDLKFYHF